MNRPTLHYIILAAGAATRFGRNKLLAEFDSTCMLDLTLRLIPSERKTIVVTGAYQHELESYLNKRQFAGQIVHNAQWQSGMGKSIAVGADTLGPPADGVMVLQGDQIKLEPDHIRKLVESWSHSPDKLVCASYSGTLGAPAIFPRRLIPALQSLNGEQGAKTIIKTESNRLAIPLEHAAWDIDTPSQLQSYLSDYLRLNTDIHSGH